MQAGRIRAVNEHGDPIEIHAANVPFDGTTCNGCQASAWKEGPLFFTLTVGGLKILLCYGCLETLSKLTKVFVFEKTILRPSG
jgi:hypothetical protein